MSPFLAQNKAPKCHSAHPREPIKKRDFFVSKTKTNLTVCHTRRMLRQLTENRDPYESTTKKLSHAEIKHGNCLMDHVPLDSTIETNRELFCLLPCNSSCRSALLLPPGPPPALVPPPATRSYSCCSVLLLPFGPPLATRSYSCRSVLLLPPGPPPALGPLPASPWLRCHFQRNGRRSFPGSGGQHLQIPGPQITVTFTGKHNRTRQVTTRLTSWQINTRLNWQAKNKLDSSNETVLD